MTITYTAEVATSKGLGCFLKLLFRWFERLSIHCQTYGNLIPVSFVLGFYVSLVIKRWWDQYVSIPWPDNLALFVSALVHGQDERGRLMRRTVARYVNLSLVLTLRMVSPRVKMRFPTMEHLVEAGFMQPTEMKIFEDLDHKTKHAKYWLPLVWASGILTRARKENRITNDFSLKTLIDELNIFRAGCGKLLSYDWISIPLVYTQVVTLAVHFYFLASLMGNQYLDVGKGYPKHQIDLVVPIFTLLEFFFYMGWLKVAESLVNPFGEDDDDFEVMWLIDRNLQMSYVIVDEMHEEHPEMLRDAYWDEVFPSELPYTAATKHLQTEPPQGSTKNVEVPIHMSDFVKDSVPLDDSEDSKDVQVGDAPSVRMRRRWGSSASVQSSSGGHRKGSVLSVLARAFHREGSAKDLEGSCRGSGTSLLSRAPGGQAGQREGRARTIYAAPSQGSSRATLIGSEFQEDMFRLSSLSVALGVAKDSPGVIEIPIEAGALTGAAENVMMCSAPWPDFSDQKGSEKIEQLLKPTGWTVDVRGDSTNDDVKQSSGPSDRLFSSNRPAEELVTILAPSVTPPSGTAEDVGILIGPAEVLDGTHTTEPSAGCGADEANESSRGVAGAGAGVTTPATPVFAVTEAPRRTRDFPQLEPILEHVEEHAPTSPGSASPRAPTSPSPSPPPPLLL